MTEEDHNVRTAQVYGLSGLRGPPPLPATGWTSWLTTLAAGVMCLLAVLTLAASMAAIQNISLATGAAEAVGPEAVSFSRK